MNTHGQNHRPTPRSFWSAALCLLVGTMAIPDSASAADYTFDYRAADPAEYSSTAPELAPCIPGGRRADPLPGGDSGTGVESLPPSYLGLGQVVAFEVIIDADPDNTPPDGQLQITLGFESETTAGCEFGFDTNYMIYCAFIDSFDTETVGDTNAFVSSVTSSLVGTEIQGEFIVDHVDPGETVVMEVWLVLRDDVPEPCSGNVQTRAISPEFRALSTRFSLDFRWLSLVFVGFRSI